MYRTSKHTFDVQNVFSKNCAFYEMMWNNMVQPDSSQKQYNMVHELCMLDN